MIILLNKLKATCPHCRHRFFRVLQSKGIHFCPHCENSLITSSASDNNLANCKKHKTVATYNISNILWSLSLYFIVLYLMLFHQNLPTQFKQFLSNSSELLLDSLLLVFITLITLMTLFFFIRITFPKVVCFFYKPMTGVDTYAQVLADNETYVRSSTQGEQRHIDNCPNCTSQRLQFLNNDKIDSVYNQSGRDTNTPSTLLKHQGSNVDNHQSQNHQSRTPKIECLHCASLYEMPSLKYRHIYDILNMLPIIVIFGIQFLLIDQSDNWHPRQYSMTQSILITGTLALLVVISSIIANRFRLKQKYLLRL